MIILDVHKKEIDLSKYKKRSALETDCSKLIDYNCLITENGKPKILYHKISSDTNAIRWAVKNIEYTTNERTDGLKTTSAIFGYSPRNVLRKDFCSATSMATKFPKHHMIICNFAKDLISLYERFFPEALQRHYEQTSNRVRSEWLLSGTCFTSGIVNKNNPLKYHHDAGNFKNVLSNMIVLKRGVLGGRLSCPEYDLKFECDDNFVVIFDGAQILHGVTPILKPKNDENCYRYSVVYYSLEQMWNCEGINEEVKRIRRIKKEREVKRIGGHA